MLYIVVELVSIYFDMQFYVFLSCFFSFPCERKLLLNSMSSTKHYGLLLGHNYFCTSICIV